ncbi:RAD55 family ATPase [Halapricum salinum]|uniref:Uncharacterized protein n=1 Tax=Halapricum salinum TaxID=1457250 RepID=A0A4D6HG73_9EURY|nr:hypothetical protein [Halapricum salinum]QCC52631.1 hypothetical protein DV733_15955 [Halapricum salinum]
MTLSTGIRAVDRTLGGGIPAGSLVVLTSPPDAQVGPLLHAGVHVRPSLYFTTIRTVSAVENELDRLLTDPQIDDIRHVGTDGALVEILAGMEALDEREDVIVDAFDPLEEAADRQSLVTFLNDFASRLQETESIGIIHCLDSAEISSNRKFTLSAADFVWRLRCRREGSEITHELEVPKASGLTLADDDRVLGLNLGQSVTVDTSRDIA